MILHLPHPNGHMAWQCWQWVQATMGGDSLLGLGFPLDVVASYVRVYRQAYAYPWAELLLTCLVSMMGLSPLRSLL